MAHRLSIAHRSLLITEGWADRIFSSRYNPFYYLGAIPVFFLWLLIISGVYLLIYYEISVKQAYQSVRHLTEEQWYAGGIMRSLHRYAADGLIIAAVLHLLRVYITDRYRDWRWIAWVSGVVLLAILWFTGILGYWMVWDERAQLIAVMTAELLDYLPIFTGQFTRSFLSNDTVTGLLFFIIVLLHLFVPLWFTFFTWIHVSRISRPVINPPRILSIGLFLILIALSLLKPAVSGPPADFSKIPAEVPIDWFYLFFYPVYEASSPGTFWLIMVAGGLLLLSAPWLKRTERLPKAEILPEKCNGCAQCHLDCPYDAINLVQATPDIKPFEIADMKAVIIPHKCAGCGICIGSCGFEAVKLSEWTDETIRNEISRILSRTSETTEGPYLLGFVCTHSAEEIKSLLDPETLALRNVPDVKVIIVPCIGMILSSLIEFAFKKGTSGIFFCGCKLGDCHYREGNKWLQARLTGIRPPALRKTTVDHTKIRTYWFSPIQTGDLLREIHLFQEDLRTKRPRP